MGSQRGVPISAWPEEHLYGVPKEPPAAEKERDECTWHVLNGSKMICNTPKPLMMVKASLRAPSTGETPTSPLKVPTFFLHQASTFSNFMGLTSTQSSLSALALHRIPQPGCVLSSARKVARREKARVGVTGAPRWTRAAPADLRLPRGFWPLGHQAKGLP